MKMNFSPFGNPFPTSLPSMHQFTAKFSDVSNVNFLNGQNTVMLAATDSSSGSVQYVPVSPAANSSITQVPGSTRLTTLPSNVQVVNASSGAKYSAGSVLGWENVSVHHLTSVDQKVVALPYSQSQQGWPIRLVEHTDFNPVPQDLCKTSKEEKEIDDEKSEPDKLELIQIPLQSAWSDGVADYLSRLPASIPLSIHHFLKYSDINKRGLDVQEIDIKHEHVEILSENSLHHPNQDSISKEQTLEEHLESAQIQGRKKKKKQKVKEKKYRYRPGEIRLSTALDGSTLFCCPECHMAYPERFSLEQHLAGHKTERRFICDVCGACLKRKEHLDQHKKGHSQERPFVCSVCTKGFKRNEHLTRHYVIHSGDKGFVCMECGKAFSRKDHLHKHQQTHIAKRVKAELSQQNLPSAPSLLVPAPI